MTCAAPAAVFAIPELLDLILSFLPGAALCPSGMVARPWRIAAQSQIFRRIVRGALVLDFARKCAEMGALQLLQWARKSGAPWDASVCAAAAKSGQLALLQWARAQDPPCPWNAATCAAAIDGDHLEVLQWARAQCPPCPQDTAACDSVLAMPELLEIIYAHIPTASLCHSSRVSRRWRAEARRQVVQRYARGDLTVAFGIVRSCCF
jgi:hypothetical protein